jgi:thiol-disulfide isomerase/thioredoxin
MKTPVLIHLLLLLASGPLACPAVAQAGELTAPEPGPPARLVLPDLDGQTIDLADLRGRVVVVNFWASWCRPCIDEMPSLQRLAEAMRGEPLAVIGVNVAEGRLRARTAARRMGIGFPVLLDDDSAVFDGWGGVGLPTTFLLDRDGVVRHVGRGVFDWDGPEIRALIDALIGEPAGDRESPASPS